MSDFNQPVKSRGSGKLTSIRPDSDLSNIVFGKLPPQAVPLEEVVLGALIIDSNALSVVMDVLSPSSFYKKAHQKIYESILHLFELNQPIDLLTLNEAMTKAGLTPSDGNPVGGSLDN